MKMKLFLAAVITVLAAVMTAKAQSTSAKITGVVTSAGAKPLDLVTVSLLKAGDSAVVKITSTAADGSFTFNGGFAQGDYRIKVTLIGYNDYISSPFSITASSTAVSVPAIVLNIVSRDIQGVTVNTKKPVVERKIDRTVINVDAVISNAGSTAMDVLAKSPGVIVDQNGNISLNGKNAVVIFIDDKPTYLDATGLENYLRSLPASALSQIEIMTNPPARYDAAGGAGIINIKTRKTKIKGFNGGLNLSINQGVLTRTSNSFNFNYRNNKVNYFGNLSVNYRNRFQDLDIYRDYTNPDGSPKSYFSQDIYNKLKGWMYNIKTGFDYYQTEKTTMGLVFTGMGWWGTNDDDNVSTFLNVAQQPYSVVNAFNASKRELQNYGVNFNYRHQFDNDRQEISADADYVLYKTRRDDAFTNKVYSQGNPTPFVDLLTGALPATIDIYAVKGDYTRVLNGGYKLTAGLKSSFIKTDNVAEYFYTASGTTSPDYDKSNTFLYKENINAAYASVSKEWKRFAFSTGLRLENTVIDGHQLGNAIKPDSMFSRSYTSLFPTLYLSYTLDTLGKHQLGLNYGRRIDRPFYQDLNPFIAPFDKFTFYVGNPFLRPSFTHSVELSYLYKNLISVVFSYNGGKDRVNETIEIRDSLYFSRPGNIGTMDVVSVTVNAGLPLTRWLSMNLNTSVTNIKSKTNFYTGPLRTSGAFLYVNPLFQFNLGKGWNAELSGTYVGKIVVTQFVHRNYWLANTAIQKQFPKNLTLKLALNDIFYTSVNAGTIYNLANTNARYQNIGDSRNVSVSLSYRFGKAIANVRRHDATSADQEKNRVKN